MILAGRSLAICGSLAAATAHSQDSPALAAVKRDLDRYTACRLNYDYDCLVALTYEIPDAARAPGAIVIPPEILRSLAAEAAARAPTTPGSRLGQVEYETPGEPFRAGAQLFTFVPYRTEGPGLPGTWRELQSFLIGVSDNAGATWRFADGEIIEPKRIDAVIPGYSGDSLPESEERFVEGPDPARSEYLRTVDAYFAFDGESAAYTLVLDIRKRVGSEIELFVSFDDPSSSDRPRSFHASLEPGQKEITIGSPPMQGFEGGELYDVVIVGNEAATGAEIFEHRQTLLFGAPYPPPSMRAMLYPLVTGRADILPSPIPSPITISGPR